MPLVTHPKSAPAQCGTAIPRITLPVKNQDSHGIQLIDSHSIQLIALSLSLSFSQPQYNKLPMHQTINQFQLYKKLHNSTIHNAFWKPNSNILLPEASNYMMFNAKIEESE